MKKTHTSTFFLGISLFLASCSKEDIGGKLSYKIKPVNTAGSIGANATGSGLAVNVNANSSVTWTSGTLNVSEIDFEAENDNREFEFELKRLVSVDLTNLSPVLGSVSIPEGVYEEVELKIELKKVTTGEAPLTLKGTYTDANGGKTPIEFYFNEEVEIKVEANNVTVKSDDYIGLINFELNRLISQVSTGDLSNTIKTDGKIVVSSTSNTHVYNKIKANFNLIGKCEFD